MRKLPFGFGSESYALKVIELYSESCAELSNFVSKATELGRSDANILEM